MYWQNAAPLFGCFASGFDTQNRDFRENGGAKSMIVECRLPIGEVIDYWFV
jgi:hypothetical protein